MVDDCGVDVDTGACPALIQAFGRRMNALQPKRRTRMIPEAHPVHF